MTAPAPPPELRTFDELPFGDTVAARHERALLAVLDRFEPRYGRVDAGRMRIERFALAPGKDLEAIVPHYARAADAAGLAPLAQEEAGPGQVAAWAKGDALLAIVMTDAADPGAPAPLTIITTLD